MVRIIVDHDDVPSLLSIVTVWQSLSMSLESKVEGYDARLTLKKSIECDGNETVICL
jgi:hypothetical protein